MARDHARLFIRIWADDEFVAMTENAQHKYMLLMSQAGANWAGVLDLRSKRWVRLASDTTAASLDKGLHELASAEFVAIDEDSEEVLIRSFMRANEVYKQPNVFKNALNAARQVQSAKLRAILAAELRKIAPLVPADRRDAETSREAVLALAETLAPKGFGEGLSEGFDQGLSEPLSEGFIEPSLVVEGEVEVVLGTSSVVTSLATKTEKKPKRRKPARTEEHPLPADWRPTDEHRTRAAAAGLDVELQAELFRANAETNERQARSWNGAFTTWLIKAPAFTQPGQHRPKMDPAAAKAWLLGEYEAGRVMPIQQRTGMHFRQPDLPFDVTGEQAIEEFLVAKAREWIKANHEELIRRLIARAS